MELLNEMDNVNDNVSLVWHCKWLEYKTKIPGKTLESSSKPSWLPQPPLNPDGSLEISWFTFDELWSRA